MRRPSWTTTTSLLSRLEESPQALARAEQAQSATDECQFVGRTPWAFFRILVTSVGHAGGGNDRSLCMFHGHAPWGISTHDRPFHGSFHFSLQIPDDTNFTSWRQDLQVSTKTPCAFPWTTEEPTTLEQPRKPSRL